MSDPIRVGPTITEYDKLREDERKEAIQARATVWAKTQLWIADVVKDNDRLKQENAELIACLKEIVASHCEQEPPKLDSMGDRSFGEAIRILAAVGVVEVTASSGSCVVGKWTEEGGMR